MMFEEIFSFTNMYKSAKLCCKGVRWKTSTQNFESKLFLNVQKLRKAVLNEKFKSKGFHEFVLRERGKTRQIKSVHITERTVQKCLCDYCLIPTFSPKFIYDNGACLKGKGTHFAIKRMKTHLHRFYKDTGSNNGYVLQFDIKSFFDNINHEVLINLVDKEITDDKIMRLYSYLVRCFGGDKGLGLGSQISQVSAAIYLNPLDHRIKDELKVKYYGRYMDDGYLISDSKEHLEYCLKEITNVLNSLKLNLSPTKTQIVHLKHGFTFLKRRFMLCKNGKIIIKPYKKNIRRYCKKYLKMLKLNRDEEALKVLRGTFEGYLKEFNYYDKYTRRIENVYFKKRD